SPGPPAPEDMERLPPGPRGMSGDRAPVWPARDRSSRSHRGTAAHPRRVGADGQARLVRTPPGHALPGRLCTAAAGARTEHEFFARLAQAGMQVHHRHSTVHPGQVTGYAVSLPNHITKDGEPIWYSGGEMAGA